MRKGLAIVFCLLCTAIVGYPLRLGLALVKPRLSTLPYYFLIVVGIWLVGLVLTFFLKLGNRIFGVAKITKN